MMTDNQMDAPSGEALNKRYRVKLENVFEGPMDLLVHLIKKAEVDIYDIPIAQITEQYLNYLEWMKQMNIDFAGDFVLMASDADPYQIENAASCPGRRRRRG